LQGRNFAIPSQNFLKSDKLPGKRANSSRELVSVHKADGGEPPADAPEEFTSSARLCGGLLPLALAECSVRFSGVQSGSGFFFNGEPGLALVKISVPLKKAGNICFIGRSASFSLTFHVFFS
jgi:hypothetical protein